MGLVGLCLWLRLRVRLRLWLCLPGRLCLRLCLRLRLCLCLCLRDRDRRKMLLHRLRLRDRNNFHQGSPLLRKTLSF